MIEFHAVSVNTYESDYEEGHIDFSWSDPLYGYEGLTIDDFGFCRRRMAFRSGSGHFRFASVQKELIEIHFESKLAQKLELDTVVRLHCAISDEDFSTVHRVIFRIEHGDPD